MAISTPVAMERGPVRFGVVVRGGLSYFALVFATGFALGVLRTLFLEPRIGAQNAELVELPWMIAACWLAARWIVARRGLAENGRACAAVGALALALLLGAELCVAATLRGTTPAEAIALRDPVSGIAYLVSLMLFAAMPSIVRKRLA